VIVFLLTIDYTSKIGRNNNMYGIATARLYLFFLRGV
jgi:hypothetical protein